jgi:hypothetical protein
MCSDDGTSCTTFCERNLKLLGWTFLLLAITINEALYNMHQNVLRDIGKISLGSVIWPNEKFDHQIRHPTASVPILDFPNSSGTGCEGVLTDAALHVAVLHWTHVVERLLAHLIMYTYAYNVM